MPVSYERTFELYLDKFNPQAAKKIHILIARTEFGKFIARQKNPPAYSIETDGHPTNSEESVKPFGVIAYILHRLPDAARFAIKTARDISPVESGRYRRSWFLLVDNQETIENNIPNGAREIILTNDQPYSRKIERRGARLRGIPPGIVERVRQITLRRFGSVSIDIRYITLNRGYRLKTPHRRGRHIQHELTYPSLSIRAKF